MQARFEGVGSRREALDILAAKANSMKPGEWIMVQGGWTPRQFADSPGGFTLEELDRVAPNNPLFVQEGYSFVYANTPALKAIELDPAEGAKRSAAGLASFQPPAKLLDALPQTSPAQLERNLPDYWRAQRDRAHRRLSLGQSQFLAASAAKGPLSVRLWESLAFNATNPATAAEAAALIERTRPNQFDGRFGALLASVRCLRAVLRSRPTRRALARRHHERVRQARDGGGARRLARAPARHQQLGRHGSARRTGAGQREAALGSACAGRSATSTTSRRKTPRARKALRHDPRRTWRRDASRRAMPLRKIAESGIVPASARTQRSSRTTRRS